MSSSKWLAAAALMALAVPAAQAGDRTRVQITIAPYWGWDGPVHYRHAPRPYRHGYRDGYRDGRYYGGPVLRFDSVWRDRDRWYRHDGYRPGGYLRYDSRRDRHYGHDRHDHDRRDWRRHGHDRRDWDRRGGDRRGRHWDR
jgi:hypothetical protein